MKIEAFSAAALTTAQDELVNLLRSWVHGGASIGFLAARLMNELETRARERGIRLLFLDTSEGPGGARELYETLGYTYAGGLPDYALDPDGRPAKNAIDFKMLSER